MYPEHLGQLRNGDSTTSSDDETGPISRFRNITGTTGNDAAADVQRSRSGSSEDSDLFESRVAKRPVDSKYKSRKSTAGITKIEAVQFSGIFEHNLGRSGSTLPITSYFQIYFKRKNSSNKTKKLHPDENTIYIPTTHKATPTMLKNIKERKGSLNCSMTHFVKLCAGDAFFTIYTKEVLKDPMDMDCLMDAWEKARVERQS